MMTQTLRAAVSILALGIALGASASWFENSQQAAYRTFQAGDYAQAAAEFDDPFRRGVALYRAGRYSDAAEAFDKVESPTDKVTARYNLGNARFQLADFAAAAVAYEQVLSANPKHDDAHYNLTIARAMLAQVQEQQFKEKEEQKKKQEEQKKHEGADKSEEQKQDSKDQSKKDQQDQKQDQQKSEDQKQESKEKKESGDQK
ncbi:MAG TPA: tetratricopeptide repeat protein, partial [Chromatiaceae bacterium]|nr:tetratricopeptide repeat protein [Chromatiaceae bacterium]